MNMNQTTECTSQCTARMAGLMFVVVTNFVLAVPTAAANALVIVAILTTSSLRTPSYLLLTNLAFSDLAVGLFFQPVYAVLLIMKPKKDVDYVLGFLMLAGIGVSTLLSIVSLFTMTAISVDRYLAIRLKMRYRSVVTVRRVKRFCVGSWVSALLLLLVKLNVYVEQIIGVCVITGCLVVTLVSYMMSFRALKIHCAQTQPQGNQQPDSTTQSNAIDVLKYRKLLKTMLLIVVVTLVCYLSLLGVLPLFSYTGRDISCIIWGLMSIVCLNSTLNPVIYLTRMKDIRQACIQKLRKLFRWENSAVGLE